MFNNYEEEEHNYWVSFTDLSLGFLIVFIVITLVLLLDKKEKASEIIETPPIRSEEEIKTAALKGKYVELQTTLKDKLGHISGIEITDDATVHFVLENTLEKALFQQGDYHPTKYTEELLNTFIPAFYDNILDIYQNQGEVFIIKELRIEGHTDSKGSYESNLHYSSGRAVKIQALIFKNKYFKKYPLDFQELVKNNSIACGYSYTRLLDEDGNMKSKTGKPEDKDKSRRVEFRVLLEYAQ